MVGRFLLMVSLLIGLAYSQSPFPLQQYGSGGAGSGNFVPTFQTGGEFPVVGNTSFQLVSKNLRGGAGGFVWISRNQANLPLSNLGITLLVDVTNGMSVTSLADGKVGEAGVGSAVTALPLPNSQALVGASLFTQGFYLDSATPLSLVHTQGLEFHFAPSVSQYVAALYDQNTYQLVVTSAAAGQAVWNANAVPGFTYVGTQQYSCGGQTFWIVTVRENRYGIEFNLIPGGNFQMGCLNNYQCNPDEKPVHWVHIQPFLLSRFEITQKQWIAVMGTTPWLGQKYVGPTSDCPASYISWNDVANGAGSFCGKTGCRLPSEAEWEYACRAGTTTVYCCDNGTQLINNYIWYSFTTMSLNERYPHPVGKKLANAFGLYDMHGNVYEYTQDKYESSYNGVPTNGSPWLSNGVIYRIPRGGYWGGSSSDCRSASRGYLDEKLSSHGHGFRPAISMR